MHTNELESLEQEYCWRAFMFIFEATINLHLWAHDAIKDRPKTVNILQYLFYNFAAWHQYLWSSYDEHTFLKHEMWWQRKHCLLNNDDRNVKNFQSTARSKNWLRSQVTLTQREKKNLRSRLIPTRVLVHFTQRVLSNFHFVR